MKRGYHASPVAYKRTHGQPTLLGLRRAKVKAPSKGHEVCTECGSDLVEREGGWVHCNSCQAEYLLALAEAPHRGQRKGRGAHSCFSCGDPIEDGDWYTKRKFHAKNPSPVTECCGEETKAFYVLDQDTGLPVDSGKRGCRVCDSLHSPRHKLVSVRQCERCARHPMSTSRAFRVEQKCERRSRPHHQRRAKQKREAKRVKDRKPLSAMNHSERMAHAKRCGFAKVDGVWKLVR